MDELKAGDMVSFQYADLGPVDLGRTPQTDTPLPVETRTGYGEVAWVDGNQVGVKVGPGEVRPFELKQVRRA